MPEPKFPRVQLPTPKTDYDSLQAETQHLPFKFVMHGRDWTLPAMVDLDVWPLVAKADLGDLASSIAVLEAAFGEQWDEFRAHPLPQWLMERLQNDYLAHSGTAPGEQPASTSS